MTIPIVLQLLYLLYYNYCTTTKSDKLRTLIQKPNLYYFTVSESAKLGYYCTTLLQTVCTVLTKIQYVNSKLCNNAKESPTLKRFYYYHQTQSALHPHILLPFFIERSIFRIWVCCGKPLFSCFLGSQGYNSGCIVPKKLGF